jgi:hypothetical protein
MSARGSSSSDFLKAFSSEVETGSRQENAPNQESRARFDFIETGLQRLKNENGRPIRAAAFCVVAPAGIDQA